MMKHNTMQQTIMLLLLVACLILTVGCEYEEATYAGDSPVEAGDSLSQEEAMAILAPAAQAKVNIYQETWDGDPEDDGYEVFVWLEDSNDNNLNDWEGIVLPVHLSIYSVESTGFLEEEKGDLLYEAEASIDSWKDGNEFAGNGIRILKEDIKERPADASQFGWIYATVTLPDGTELTGKDELVNLEFKEE